MLKLMFTKKAKLPTNRLTFLVLKNGVVPIGYAESYMELWSDSGGAIPLPELRGAGFVNEETGIIEFTRTAFGIRIAASQDSLAREIAGAALLATQANESAYRQLSDDLKQLVDISGKIAGSLPWRDLGETGSFAYACNANKMLDPSRG